MCPPRRLHHQHHPQCPRTMPLPLPLIAAAVAAAAVGAGSTSSTTAGGAGGTGGRRSDSDPTPACAANLDAYCGNASDPGLASCYASIRASHRETPLVAAYSGDIKNSEQIWRCYSPSDLSGGAGTPVMLRHFVNHNATCMAPHCCCTAPTLRKALARCDPSWAPPPAPPGTHAGALLFGARKPALPPPKDGMKTDDSGVRAHDDDVTHPGQQTPVPTAITLAANASPTEVYAASVLAEHLHLPTVSAGTTAAAGEGQQVAHVIAVGFGASRAAGVSAAQLEQTADLSGDAFCLLSGVAGVQSGSVAVGAGLNSTRGSMNGAFELLRQLGFKHLAPSVTIRPTLPIGQLPWQQLNLTYSPVFESRDLENYLLGAGSRYMGEHVRGWPKFEGANFSAALGFNGRRAFAPVGKQMAPTYPPGFDATAYNLMTPSGTVFDCAAGKRSESNKGPWCVLCLQRPSTAIVRLPIVRLAD